MRKIPVSNLFNKFNVIANSNTGFCTRYLSCNLNNNILNKKQQKEAPKFSNSNRYSSGGSHGGSGFGATGIVYTLLGAGFAGGAIAVYLTSGDENKKIAKTVVAASSNRTEINQVEKEASEAVETVADETESEPPQPTKIQETENKAKENYVSTSLPKNKSASGTDQDEANFLSDIPSYAQYLIVGGGTAALSAFKAIRAKDAKAKILVVTEEDYKPYMRPPLSKDLWMTDDEKLISELRFKQYNGNERSLFFLEDEFYTDAKTLNQNPNGGVAVVTGRKVVDVDVQNQTVRLDNNWEITYDKCLIATGGRPKNLPAFEKQWEKLKDNVTLFRNIEDFKKLYSIAKQGKTIAIVGGGFLGSELACALGKLSKKNGGKVIQIFPESGNLRRVLPEYLSEWATARVKEEGVEIISETNVKKAQINDRKIELGLEPSSSEGKSSSPQQWLLADHVIVAVGLEPNVQLASKSGFEIDPKFGGYLVNAELQARKNIWVAGDAACFYDIKLGRRRVEHHDHAVVSGRLAGENMTGAGKPYFHQSMFWSDLGPKIGFEAIGLVDSSLQTVGLFAKADESDTPQAQVNESNETLRSEIKDTKIPDVKPFKKELRTPSKIDDFGKGVILYLKNETIVGVLLWNVFKRIPIARQLIQEQEKATDYTEMAKLFKINATGVEESDN